MLGYAVMAAATLTVMGAATADGAGGESLTAEVMGAGMHTFYSHDYQKAFALFSSAIDRGSQDARGYYFRGLACERMGRPEEAVADFKKGGELEAGSDAQYRAVSEALQRIQGAERLALEPYRQVARAAAHQRSVERVTALEEKHHREVEAANEEAARKMAAAAKNIPPPPVAAPPATSDSNPSEPPPASQTAPADPFAKSAQPAAADLLATPATPAADPFGGAAASGKANASDPFAAGPATPADSKAGTPAASKSPSTPRASGASSSGPKKSGSSKKGASGAFGRPAGHGAGGGAFGSGGGRGRGKRGS